jgi:hypothetical protein
MDYKGCSLDTVLTELFLPHLNCIWLPNEKTTLGIFSALGYHMDYKQAGQAGSSSVEETNAY